LQTIRDILHVCLNPFLLTLVVLMFIYLQQQICSHKLVTMRKVCLQISLNIHHFEIFSYKNIVGIVPVFYTIRSGGKFPLPMGCAVHARGHRTVSN